jgi:hypothetical protein
MTDQELQKIAEKITNTVSDNDGRLAFSKIVDSVSFQLRQVRDAQEEKLRIAREAMYILKNQGNCHSDDCGIWLSDCNDDEYESPLHKSCSCGLKELHEKINEALEKIGGGE